MKKRKREIADLHRLVETLQRRVNAQEKQISALRSGRLLTIEVPYGTPLRWVGT